MPKCANKIHSVCVKSSVIIDMAVNGIFMCSVFVIITQYIQVTSSFEFPETHVVDGQEILTPKLNESDF